jgi:hypothetical protein
MSCVGLVGQISHNILCCYRVFVGKPEGKRPLGRPKRRWEDIIYHNGSLGRGMGYMDWIDLAGIGTGGGHL